MRDTGNPLLSDWAIVRISPLGYIEYTAYHFTGVCEGHPLLPDGARIVTTAVQEIAEDERWGRSRSRVYGLGQKLPDDERSEELETEVTDILYQVFGLDCDIEWISVEEWRRAMDSSSTHCGNA